MAKYAAATLEPALRQASRPIVADLDLPLGKRVREKWNMPLVVWSYPRGEAIETKGGRDSLYAVDYAARLAHELGADIITLNVPKASDKDAKAPKPYNTLKFDYEEGVRRVVESGGRSLVLTERIKDILRQFPA